MWLQNCLLHRFLCFVPTRPKIADADIVGFSIAVFDECQGADSPTLSLRGPFNHQRRARENVRNVRSEPLQAISFRGALKELLWWEAPGAPRLRSVVAPTVCRAAGSAIPKKSPRQSYGDRSFGGAQSSPGHSAGSQSQKTPALTTERRVPTVEGGFGGEVTIGTACLRGKAVRS